MQAGKEWVNIFQKIRAGEEKTTTLHLTLDHQVCLHFSSTKKMQTKLEVNPVWLAVGVRPIKLAPVTDYCGDASSTDGTRDSCSWAPLLAGSKALCWHMISMFFSLTILTQLQGVGLTCFHSLYHLFLCFFTSHLCSQILLDLSINCYHGNSHLIVVVQLSEL